MQTGTVCAAVPMTCCCWLGMLGIILLLLGVAECWVCLIVLVELFNEILVIILGCLIILMGSFNEIVLLFAQC